MALYNPENLGDGSSHIIVTMRFLLPFSVSILLAGCASSLSIRADVNGSSPSSGDTGNSTSSNPPTNLPPPDYEGPFTVQTAVQIDAPLDKVWDAFTDFAKYPEWYLCSTGFETCCLPRLTDCDPLPRNPFVCVSIRFAERMMH